MWLLKPRHLGRGLSNHNDFWKQKILKFLGKRTNNVRGLKGCFLRGQVHSFGFKDFNGCLLEPWILLVCLQKILRIFCFQKSLWLDNLLPSAPVQVSRTVMRRYRVDQECTIATVWAKMSPSNTCYGSFGRPLNCISKEKDRRKCNFSLRKIFLKQYFGWNSGGKQEPKSREHDICKTINFLRLQGTILNKCYRGVDYVDPRA